MIPELFFGDVFVWSTGDANNTSSGFQFLFFVRIPGIDCRVFYQACNEIDSGNIRAPGECTSEINDVFCLPSRISIASQLQAPAANQSVDTKQAYIEAFSAVVYLCDN